MLLEELSARHAITLIALVWDARDDQALDEFVARGVTVHRVPHPATARVRGLVADPRQPLQRLMSSSKDFAREARRLIAAGNAQLQPFDAIHVEHLRGASAIDLAAGLPLHCVFDSVDCISELARLTAQHATHPVVRR